ncbi:excinuclease ABC subunit UvrC [Reichenbachiella carrageenanivorans]|uniref:UvrABC system protein C n=1 Tax=Reichenbachiella carrageenanivorans TaxID=2979869 RepID=A0ABY6D1Y8_9BACT|nr:excinuclease ABC subunit UvrC [Reichenbachiella carrageenanivorans]UXX80151.1 excinuclease ABC subunit UvrC [Reichenbachiella carrageenanivorans]
MGEKLKYPIDLKSLPSTPGVYKYFHKEVLIYVGKAKNIKKRVSSYFNKQTGNSLKTRKLVNEIDHVEYVIVNSEYDALLLENNLIKENQPKYNILLKDDKSFPFICISNDRFPKIYTTRRNELNEGEYFGPYTSVRALNNVIELIRSLYKVRTCNYLLSEKNIANKKFKVCLEYHIGNCLGPCEGLQTEEDYLKEIDQAKHIIKGHLKIVKDHYLLSMKNAAENLAFEDAQEYKTKIELLDKFQSHTVIVNKKLKDIDVITITSTEKKAFINYMRVDNGMVNISDSLTINKRLDETDEQILELLIIELRDRFSSNSKTILSNKSFEFWQEDTEVAIPQIGDKKKLVELSLKNALYHKKEAISQAEKSKQKENRVTQQLMDDLKLKVIPNHIECFDNSNIQGTNPVASMVCFKNGKPSKKDYRHYKIKTIVGPDDFGSMREIVTRRYKRLQEENLPFPNLILIDGGKGQLHAACDALKDLGIYSEIPVIGIAKRLEEIYYPEDSIPLHISKKSESLKLLQQLRDEAHRFAITFHRSLRSKSQVTSELDVIPGIGPQTRQKLLSKFKSYKKILQASEAELVAEIGVAKTQVILDYTQKKGSN